MSSIQTYRSGFTKRYSLDINIWKALFSFFGLYENLYENAVTKIDKKSTHEALLSDVQTIRQDAKRVLHERGFDDLSKVRTRYALKQEPA